MQEQLDYMQAVKWIHGNCEGGLRARFLFKNTELFEFTWIIMENPAMSLIAVFLRNGRVFHFVDHLRSVKKYLLQRRM